MKKSTSMKKRTNPQTAVGLAWKPRLKNATPRNRPAATEGTTHAADQALLAIQSIDKLRAEDGEVDEYRVAQLAKRCGTQEAGRGPEGEAAGQRPAASKPQQGHTGLLASVAVAVGIGLALFGSGVLGSSRHAVTGKAWLDRRPLGAAELRFHRDGRGSETLTVVAAQDGTFELTGVESGSYRVTVHAPSQSSSTVIASTYTKPETTPLQLHINRDISSLQLYAYRFPPKPRKATWARGVD